MIADYRYFLAVSGQISGFLNRSITIETPGPKDWKFRYIVSIPF